MRAIAAFIQVCLVAFFLGCASQPTPEPTQLAQASPENSQAATDEESVEELRQNSQTVAISPGTPNDDVYCVMEKRTGSHMREERCYSRSAQQRVNREAQEWLRTGGQRGSISNIGPMP